MTAQGGVFVSAATRNNARKTRALRSKILLLPQRRACCDLAVPGGKLCGNIRHPLPLRTT